MNSNVANGGNDFNFDIPKMGSVGDPPVPEAAMAGTIDESMLSPEDKEKVDQILQSIDVTNVEQIIQYGAPAQKNISSFSASVLSKVKTSDLGDIGDAIKDLTVVLNDSVAAKRSRFALFRKAKMSIDAVKAKYSKAEANVNQIEADLRTHQDVLSNDITMYQQMYDLNLQYYKDLTIYIIAGKKALAQARTETLPALKEAADRSQTQEDVQAFRDFEDLRIRFDKRLVDLELTRMISIQTAPQIRLLQNNDREMLDKIQSSLSNTIPLWRNQLVLSLGIEHSQRAIDAQRYLSEKTNELLVKNAETLKMASVNAAMEAERPIVDMGALARCNAELITSITEVMRIHEEGESNRIRARQELLRLEEELKSTLVDER